MRLKKYLLILLIAAALLTTGLLVAGSNSNAISSVRLVGSQLFYLQSRPHSKQKILMVRKVSDPTGRQLLDPGALATEEQQATIVDIEPSWNGRYVAVGLQPDGVIRVVRVSDGEVLKDSIRRTVDGYAGWNDADDGFYYRAFQSSPAGSPPVAKFDNMRAYLHRLGNDSELDEPVFGPDISPELHLPKSGFINAFPIPQTKLLMAVQSSARTELDDFWVRDQAALQPRWRQIADHKDDILFEFATRQSQFYYITTARAPNGRVMTFDASREDVSNAVEILPQSDLVLSDTDSCGIVGAQDALYVYGLRAAVPVVVRIPYEHPTQREEIPLPGAGTLSDVSGDYRVGGFVFTLSRKFRSSVSYVYDPVKKVSEQVAS